MSPSASIALQQLALPMMIASEAIKKGLMAFVQQMGMLAFSEMLEAEAAEIAGPKGRHADDRTHHHWGTARTSPGGRLRSIMESMLSSSVGPTRWVVVVEGREHIVDVIWPGFANSIAVDGQLVQSWWWPGNNLRVVRKFELHGIACRLVRQRSGLVSYTFDLQVGSPNALVRRIPS